MQRILTRLATAGWIDRSAVVDPTKKRRGKIQVSLTHLGAAHVLALKDIYDSLGELSDEERKDFHDLLRVWTGHDPRFEHGAED